MESKKVKKLRQGQEGITLVALIITIIVLVILVAVSIIAVYNSKIVNYAINGTYNYAQEGIIENKVLEGTESLIKSAVDTLREINGGQVGNNEPPKDTGKGPNGKTLVTTLTTIQIREEKAEDKLGNPITIPEGFKVRTDLGEVVEKGIVIEDIKGNQFVWVPVSNINNDGSKKIKRENGTEVEITLGRYTFNESTGEVNTEEGAYQYASNYEAESVLESSINKIILYKELTEYRVSNGKSDVTATNTTAKDLKGFIESVERNHGYYIARYEASYGSGSSIEDWRPLSKASTANSTSEMNYTEGTLWNRLSQPDAAQICQNMYRGNVKSDLVNSYAWDTAIVFIQEMEDRDYSIKKDGNRTLRNTGETEDIACNIFDMSGNLNEWTTELSTVTIGNYASPCGYRGGSYNSNNFYTSSRLSNGNTSISLSTGFRSLLYV